ncbi:MAG: hypothetical protein EA406_12460 [Rhodospirillales bacterium]|nr:MAG: hypothetical protein EA406_12460 [Rhodospirillales bacterium]
MIIRQGLNFAAHFAAGLAFGALAVAAVGACLALQKQRQHPETQVWEPTMPPPSPPPATGETGWGEPPGTPAA